MATRKCRYGRKKSGSCKRKPGPKRSSRKRCKRGYRKGTHSCKRRPGPRKRTRKRSRRSRFRMQSRPNINNSQWGCSKYLKKPCNETPWCKYVKGKGCRKNNNYTLEKSLSNPFVSKPRQVKTPCAIDTKLPKKRRESLCNLDPNCTWTGKFCKFQPRKLKGTTRLTQYGDYQGPMNRLPEYRPIEKKSSAKENWKKATRAAKEDLRKRRKEAEKIRKEEEKRRKEMEKKQNKEAEKRIKELEKRRKELEKRQAANPFAKKSSSSSNKFF